MDLLLPTPAEAVSVGLEMLAGNAKNLRITWSPEKYMQVTVRSGRFQVLSCSQGEVMLDCLNEQQILARLKSMSRTSRSLPLIAVKSKRGALGRGEVLIPLFVPISEAIHTGTEYIGANFMTLEKTPLPLEIFRDYVFFKSELGRNGKAPKTYHKAGIAAWKATGRTTHPVTKASLAENLVTARK